MLVGSILFLLLLAPSAVFAQVKAFPTAEGFGANAIGGRGGRVIEVTHTRDDGSAGGLRQCVEATGPRTCVFRVGGTIALSRSLNVQAANSYLTVAGQTAPGDGIQIINHDFNISYGAHDVILRFVRLRRGTAALTSTSSRQECNGISPYGATQGPIAYHTYNIIIDHSDIYWSCGDSSGAWGWVTDFTLQWSIVGEGLAYSDFPNMLDGGSYGKGILIGGGFRVDEPYAITASIHHNLFAHNQARLPNITSGKIVDYRNNIVYDYQGCRAANFGHGLPVDGFPDFSVNANVVGNIWLAGPNGVGSTTCRSLGTIGGSQTKLYVKDNRTQVCPTGAGTCSGNEWNDMGLIDDLLESQAGTVVWSSEAKFRAANPFASPTVVTTPARDLQALLEARVGATKPVRDALDAKVIADLRNGTGYPGRNGDPLPNLQSGTPPADTDRDGMPDSWETARGLNPNNASDGALKSAINDYTNLENYLNELAGDPIPGSRTPPPPPPPAPPPAPVSVAFAAPTPNQVVIASGTVAGGAARVDLPVTIKASNAVKIELSRDAPSPECPSCGAVFYTWTAPTSGADIYSVTMCANCMGLAETLPRNMTLHARAYDSAGGTKQADVTVTVTTQINAFDLNGDGSVNVSDVQAAVNQTLIGTCGSADVDRDGACTVADVQLVINKALGV